MAAKVLATKTIPDNYPEDALKILEAMSFRDGLVLLGSMALRSQRYAGDYDGYEIVELHYKSDRTALTYLANRFKEIIRGLQKMKHVFIGDIKAGSVEEWRVIPKEEAIDWKAAAEKVRSLCEAKVITKAEEKEALAVLDKKDGIVAREILKFHVVRWKPFEVLRGFVKLRDGRKMTLQQAFSCPTIAKLDVIGFVQNSRFTDFSAIYEFKNNGKTLNPDVIDIATSLKRNITALKQEGNYFKALKRKFALAKVEDNRTEIKRLSDIFNSDLGLLYQITGDIDTLVSLLAYPDAPLTAIRFEIDQFRSRLSNIYSITDYVKKEPAVLRSLNKLLTLPRGRLAAGLSDIAAVLNGYLQDAAKRFF